MNQSSISVVNRLRNADLPLRNGAHQQVEARGDEYVGLSVNSEIEHIYLTNMQSSCTNNCEGNYDIPSENREIGHEYVNMDDI